MKKFFPLVALATMLYASLLFSCHADLDMPETPDEKFNTVPGSKGSSSSNASKQSSSSVVANKNSDTFTDSRDGKTYDSVKIGTQTWMANNLNYNATGSKCYNDLETSCEKFGRLYDWATAMSACPDDWHLPTEKEWGEITGASIGQSSNNGSKNLDAYGFAALLGGSFSDGNFAYADKIGFYWTAKESTTYRAYVLNISSEGGEAEFSDENKTSSLCSVRCVKNSGSGY